MNEDSKQKIVTVLRRKLTRFLIGLLIFGLIFIIDVYLTKGTIYFLMSISIACTAGIGSIFWIFLFYAIGKTLCELIIFIFFPLVKTYSNEYDEALDQFITGAKAKGFTKDKVISLLINAGWKETQYKDILEKYYS